MSVALNYVPSRATQAAAWAETAAAQARAATVCKARSAVLVSVPTSGQRHSGPVVEAIVRGNRADLCKALGAFELDSAARRLMNLRMTVGFSARAHAVSDKGSRSDVAWMVTLTYAGDNDAWRATHLKTAVKAFRRWCQGQGFSARYVWVAELQKRGVIHYHLAAWLPVGVRMPKWDKKGWWGHGRTNTLKAKHATAYLMSYLKKGDLEARGKLPKGARNYGVGGLDHSLRRARRWLRLPSFVQANSSIHDDWKRRVGGGWTAPDGSHAPSEFKQINVGGRRCLVRVAEHARAIEASGPFSWFTDRAIGSLAVH